EAAVHHDGARHGRGRTARKQLAAATAEASFRIDLGVNAVAEVGGVRHRAASPRRPTRSSNGRKRIAGSERFYRGTATAVAAGSEDRNEGKGLQGTGSAHGNRSAGRAGAAVSGECTGEIDRAPGQREIAAELSAVATVAAAPALRRHVHEARARPVC